MGKDGFVDELLVFPVYSAMHRMLNGPVGQNNDKLPCKLQITKTITRSLTSFTIQKLPLLVAYRFNSTQWLAVYFS